jgi:peptide-methionine (R)-S-oxide reductase
MAEKETRTDKVTKTDEEWRQQLSPEQYQVTRHAGTEPAFTGKYWKTKGQGSYNCVCCGEPLFTSDT